MQTNALVVLIYGVLVLFGGVMGWMKAKSKPSLYSGVGFGMALIYGAYLINQGNAKALPGTAVLAGLLLFVMGIRYGATRKFMPAGLVTLMSLIVLIVLLKAIRG